MAEDITAKDLNEQILVGTFELVANETSKSELSVADVLESDRTQDEQVCTPIEEMKEVKDGEEEVQEEADAHFEKIDPEAPEISLLEPQHDQKPERHIDNAMEANDIKRDEIVDEEV